MSETEQAMDALTQGSKVQLTADGCGRHHERLHGQTGTITLISENAFIKGEKTKVAVVSWSSIVVNSGSTESLKPGGPFAARTRAAASLIPLECLELAS